MDLSQANIDKTIETISEIINLAPLGLTNWTDITHVMTQLFPGSFSGLINYDIVENTMPFFEVAGLEESFVRSYGDYYHSINPYEKHWRAHHNGSVWISDYVLPVSQLRKDEFYNDWMSRLGSFDSAIGVKLNPTAENEVRFNLHFATSNLGVYEAPAKQIFNRVRAPLMRAIDVSKYLSDNQIKLATMAALLDRKDKAAFVVDMSARLKESNVGFEDYLEKSVLFKCEHEQLCMFDHQQDERFKELIRQMALSTCAQTSKMLVRKEEGGYVLSFTRLPAPLNVGPLLPNPLVLITVTCLHVAETAVDLSEFTTAYNLTQAEERLCQMLLQSQSLSQAATQCSITYETARSRIKDIFSKTQTSKQVELIMKLNQYRLG